MRLNTSLRTVAHWEAGRQPGGESLLRLIDLALESGTPDIARVFREALAADSGTQVIGALPYRTNEEWAFMRAVQWILRDERFKTHRKPLQKTLEPALEHMAEIGEHRLKGPDPVFAALDKLAAKQREQHDERNDNPPPSKKR